MNDLTLIAISLIYIGLVIALSSLVKKKASDGELSRKIVHILLANWIFLAPLFDSIFFCLVLPFAFIIINSLSVKYDLISSMEREGSQRNWGTVYYAIGLFVVTGLSYISGMWSIALIGMLVLGYGDGLAALIGRKYGKANKISEAGKSLAGSLVVFLAGFFISLLVGLYGMVRDQIGPLPIQALLLISILTGLYSALLEISGTNGRDNISLPIFSGIFASLLLHFFTIGQLIVIGLSSLIIFYAARRDSITLDGSLVALATGQTLYVFGGPFIYLSLIVFFILASLATKIKNKEKEEIKKRPEKKGRNWVQVISNSFPAVVIVWISYLTSRNDILVLAHCVFSAACADTFSSEIGSLSKGKVFNLFNGNILPKGLSGGVTSLGLVAGFFGSLILSTLALANFGLKGFLISTVLGFLGTLIDSSLGLFFQKKYRNSEGILQDIGENKDSKPVAGLEFVTNDLVNFTTVSLIPLIGTIFVL